MGLSLVWLNSETGSLEKPARKSRLLTPVTLRVWRSLQLAWTDKEHQSCSTSPADRSNTRSHTRSGTLRVHAPGRGNLRLTTRAELGMLSSSVRPCSRPTTRPGEEIRTEERQQNKVNYTYDWSLCTTATSDRCLVFIMFDLG